jgi:hypothetical protein
MKVQELIDRLADFRADAEVIFWIHDENGGKEFANPIINVARDNQGCVGINWNEDGKTNPAIEIPMTDE